MRKASLALVVMLGLAGPARADQIVSKTGGVAVEVPVGYKGGSNLERALSVTDPTDNLELVFLVVDGKDIKSVKKTLEHELRSKAQGLKWQGMPDFVMVNGMQGAIVHGSAKVKGQPAAV